MDTSFNTITPTFHEHEGYTFLEFNGEYFKGCKRCGGAGQYSFNGEHSRCYTCDNTSAKLGEPLGSLEAAQKWCHGKAVRRAQADRKRAAKLQEAADKAAANAEALKATDPEVYEFLMSIVIEDDTQSQYATYEEWAAVQSTVKLEKDAFIRTMAETLRWVGPSKPFTPNMVAAVRRTMEKRAAKTAEAAAHPAPAGRVAVTGEITSTKLVENDFGYAYKILVKDDAGYKVWCSIPKAQAEQAEDELGLGWLPQLKGRRISFTATLTPSQDDVAFAFGSRPAKGAWL
jgi:hypothetical protein